MLTNIVDEDRIAEIEEEERDWFGSNLSMVHRLLWLFLLMNKIGCEFLIADDIKFFTWSLFLSRYAISFWKIAVQLASQNCWTDSKDAYSCGSM